ncbi:hypothetical protein [Variovorax paradoxus]|uniref:hypothetical protein n=1 Tax=Variovorax paradoxus TaxID=34073 RepID=UPI003D64775A
MTTTTTGVFFVGKDYPGRPAVTADRDPDGSFVLRMRLIDNQGPGRIEGYAVRWVGPEAQAWRIAHMNLKAGDALALTLVNPRSLLGTRGSPETTAQVVRCELLPPRSLARGTAPAAAQPA